MSSLFFPRFTTDLAMDICVANNQFTMDLLSEISRRAEGQNVVFSSISMITALAMVYLGARGNTAAQMGKVLHFTDACDVHPKVKALLNDLLKTGQSYTLINVNKLFGAKAYQFSPTFLEDTKTLYDAALEEVDFYNDAEVTRQYINTWIKQQTKDKIQNLLPENSITSKTVLVAANTLYFIANWTKQFNEVSTYKAPFTLMSNAQVTVDMMFIRNTFNIRYIANPGATILELPYGYSQDLSMFIILPDNNTVFEQLDHISYDNLTKWTSQEKMELVNLAVHLPRFKIVQSFSLRDSLSSLGMPEVFSPSMADFSGMTKQHNLFVSDVYHKTFLAVNEKGTEAASAAAPVMAFRSLESQEVKANRPFHLFIRHNKTKCILLYGKLCHP
ncbi:hypothetical protein FKM82_006490 [Ascaphus truei]